MVRAMNEQNSSQRSIVVGVDGSESSRAALRWASRQARLTGCGVQAVIAWHHPVMAGGFGWAPVSEMDITDFKELAAKQLAEVIADEIDPGLDVRVRSSVVEGNAAQVLLEAAREADLLVVGSRRHGGFTSALLGSVSQHCAHLASCPIVIIRAAGNDALRRADLGHADVS
jgi:nucleotide-binding universal stress UspA family protein